MFRYIFICFNKKFCTIINDNFKNISSQKHLLSELANPKSKYRTSILKKAQPELVLAICESVYNLLEGKLPLDKEKKDSLLKYKHILRKLVQKNNLKYKKIYWYKVVDF